MHQIQDARNINTERLTLCSERHPVATRLRSLDVDVSVDDIALVPGHKRPYMKVPSICTAKDFIRAEKAIRKLLDALVLNPAEKKDDSSAATANSAE